MHSSSGGSAASAPEAGSRRLSGKRLQAVVYLEPSLTHQFLPGCPDCNLRHPRAHAPPVDQDQCLGCGLTLVPGPAVVVPAVLTGTDPMTLLARLFLRLGQALALLWRRI